MEDMKKKRKPAYEIEKIEMPDDDNLDETLESVKSKLRYTKELKKSQSKYNEVLGEKLKAKEEYFEKKKRLDTIGSEDTGEIPKYKDASDPYAIPKVRSAEIKPSSKLSVKAAIFKAKNAKMKKSDYEKYPIKGKSLKKSKGY